MPETRRGQALVLAALAAFQAFAALYFTADALAESGGSGLGLLDIAIAMALLAGTVLGAVAARRLLREAGRQDAQLAVARGAIGALLQQRFDSWGLSAAEPEVALFAIKGCPIGEIAALRGSAEGTVRSQLSQVYAKAGVGGQAALMAAFLDDLVEARIGVGD